MEIIDLELKEQLESTSTEIDFTAGFKDFTLKGIVDLDIDISEHKDEDVGIMSDSYYLKGLTFWYLKAKNDAGVEISLIIDDLRNCKYEIESKLEILTKEIVEK